MEERQIFLIIFIVIVFIVFKLFYLKNKTKIQEKVQNIKEEYVKNILLKRWERVYNGIASKPEIVEMEGIIEEEEEEMIHSIFEFTDTTVGEILTPRITVFALEMEKTLEEVWDEIVEQGFSRIPIYDKTIDKIIGILHTKELLKYDRQKDGKVRLKELTKKAFFIPTTKTLVEVLEDFKRKRTHIAIIVDEYGGTEGIVTIEDVIEEIVGEIQDEFDQEDEVIQQIGEKVYDIRSDISIEEVNDEFEIDIPLSEEYDTISGYIQDELGKVAEEGDQVRGTNFILKVMEVDNKRIEKIRVIIMEKDKEQENGDGN